MLPTATQRRFLSALPNTVDIHLPEQNQTRRYRFETWWSREDHDIVYPSIVCTLDPRGVLRTDEQPLDDVLRSAPSDVAGRARETVRGHRLYDGLSVLVADRGMSDGLSSADRAAMMAEKIARWLRLQLHHTELARSGPGFNEIPILVPRTSISGPHDRSGMVEDSAVSRYEIRARIYYTYAAREVVDAVADTDIGWRSGF